MLSTSPNKLKAAKRNNEIKDFFWNTNSNAEIWGGVGIAALDWNPLEKDILAIVTEKTNRLEIWSVKTGRMISILDLKTKIHNIKWNPHNPSQLIAL